MTHRSHSAQPAVTRPSGRNRLARVVDAAGEETGAITAAPDACIGLAAIALVAAGIRAKQKSARRV